MSHRAEKTIHFQTVFLDVITVAGRFFIVNYKLPTTIVADVILLTSFDAIFTDISTDELRAFHGSYPRFRTLIMQRQKSY